jgi:hypothetical protein
MRYGMAVLASPSVVADKVRMKQAEAGVVSLGFLLSALGVVRVVPVALLIS